MVPELQVDPRNLDWVDIFDILGNDSAPHHSGEAATDPSPLSSDSSSDGGADPLRSAHRAAETADEKVQARMERKRRREKQNRSDIKSQFADLSAMLKKVQGEEDSDDEGEKVTMVNSPTNRVDLIAKTISVLNQMHQENCKRRRVIVDLKKELGEVKRQVEEKKREHEGTQVKTHEQNQVMMMVPMMIGPDGIPRPTPHTASYMSHAMQYFPPVYHPPLATAEAPLNNPYMFPLPVWTKKSEPMPCFPPFAFHMGDKDQSYDIGSAQEGHAPVPAVSVADVGANLAHCA